MAWVLRLWNVRRVTLGAGHVGAVRWWDADAQLQIGVGCILGYKRVGGLQSLAL